MSSPRRNRSKPTLQDSNVLLTTARSRYPPSLQKQQRSQARSVSALWDKGLSFRKLFIYQLIQTISCCSGLIRCSAAAASQRWWIGRLMIRRRTLLKPGWRWSQSRTVRFLHLQKRLSDILVRLVFECAFHYCFGNTNWTLHKWKRNCGKFPFWFVSETSPPDLWRGPPAMSTHSGIVHLLLRVFQAFLLQKHLLHQKRVALHTIPMHTGNAVRWEPRWSASNRAPGHLSQCHSSNQLLISGTFDKVQILFVIQRSHIYLLKFALFSHLKSLWLLLNIVNVLLSKIHSDWGTELV